MWTLLNDTTRAQSAVTQAAALMAGKVPEQHSSWVRLHLLQARIDGARGNLRNARALCTLVIGLLQGRGATTSALVSAYRLRAEFESRDGNNPSALADAEAAVEIATKLHGGVPNTWSDDLGLAQLSLGRVLRAAGQPERARAALQTAAEHLAGSLGDAHPETRAVRALLEQKGG